MRGIIINCPVVKCRKMLMKNTYLRPGSFLTIRCFHCGMIIEVVSEQGEIQLSIKNAETIVDKPVEKSEVDEDDEDDIMFISV